MAKPEKKPRTPSTRRLSPPALDVLKSLEDGWILAWVGIPTAYQLTKRGAESKPVNHNLVYGLLQRGYLEERKRDTYVLSAAGQEALNKLRGM